MSGPKVFRRGADVRTAFGSQLKRSRSGPGGADGSRWAEADPSSDERAGASGFDRLAKPLLRPFVARLRRVLVGPLEEEVRQSRRRIDEIWQYSQASARRLAIPIGHDRVLVRTEVGYVLCSTDDLGTLAVLVERGDLEPGTRLMIQQALEPGDTFVDVGANLGLHTLAAARALQGRGRVVAIEPFGPTVELLRESIFINGFADLVEIHQAAAADREGTAALFLGRVSGHHSLLELPPSAGSPSSAVDVPLVTLDAVLRDSPPPTLIKIDVEGAELEVVEGARTIITGAPDLGLVVEYGPSHLGRAGHDAREWFARFEGLGLVFREIDAETGRLYERSAESLADVESANLLFARPEADVWRRAAR